MRKRSVVGVFGAVHRRNVQVLLLRLAHYSNFKEKEPKMPPNAKKKVVKNFVFFVLFLGPRGMKETLSCLIPKYLCEVVCSHGFLGGPSFRLPRRRGRSENNAEGEPKNPFFLSHLLIPPSFMSRGQLCATAGSYPIYGGGGDRRFLFSPSERKTFHDSLVFLGFCNNEKQREISP